LAGKRKKKRVLVLPTKDALGAQVQQTSKNAATPPPINATKSLACGIALLDTPSSARSSRPKKASRQGDLFYGSIRDERDRGEPNRDCRRGTRRAARAGPHALAGHEVMIDLASAHKLFNLAAMRSNADVKRYRMENAHEVSKAEIDE
jgi:hypothetical protein